MSNKPEVYTKGNQWQKKVYTKMSEFVEAIPEVTTFGQSSNGNQYKHLLPIEQSKYNFVNEEIHTATRERFNQHKAGDLKRVLTNTAASQPYCFNLIIYLQQNLPLADKLFSNLLNKEVIIKHLEPEFTPNMCENIEGFERKDDESIGDQNLKFGSGTDADIAVFYTYEENKKGVLLIEFKFIESEFSVCSSYSGSMRKKNETSTEKQERIRHKEMRQSICNSLTFYNEMVDSVNSLCGYNKYLNWRLTEKSSVIDIEKIKVANSCPFRFGLNQLWRNFILSEKIAKARDCDEFGFWVFSPIENDKYLWKNGNTETQFREILTEKGNKHFEKVYLETILDILSDVISEKDLVWLEKLEAKYRVY